MDLENAEPAADAIARRGLFARVGVAGLAGVAAALVVDRSALASPDDEERPNVPTGDDKEILSAVIGIENAISGLYRARLDSGVPDELAGVVGVMAENHQAYAQAVSGATGLSAQDSDNTDLFDAFEDAFTGSADDFFAAAHQIEQTAVATHISLISDYESDTAIRLTASILAVEARHATVLADLLGVSDFDIIFGNEQTALTISGDDA